MSPEIDQHKTRTLKQYEGDPQFAITLAKGLELLTCFTPQRPTLGNKELADLTGLSKSTISRFTYTLTRLGYLQADTFSRKFKLAPAVLSIGYPVLANIAIRQIARPMMGELAEQIQGSVSMGIRNGLDIIYVETSRHRSIFNTRMSDIGLSVSLVGSAIGRAYLCGSTDEQRTKLLNEVKVKRPGEWEQHIAAVRQSIEEFKEKGFCTSKGDISPDVYGVGVPLKHAIKGDQLVFNCVIHAYQDKAGTLENEIGPRLSALVKQLDALAANARL
jgi:DNA-binding IclR family transcriptional regulator